MKVPCNPNDPRIRRTKRNLKNTFIQLMKIKPFHAITVTDIVKHADYNRTTFYRHYESKEDLVAELMNDMTEELVIAFRYPYRKGSCLNVTKLTPADVIIFEYILKHKEFYSLWKDGEGVSGFQQQFIETMIKLHKQDIYYKPIEIKDEYFIIYQAYGVWGLILNWIRNDFQPTAQEMAEELIKIINYRPPKVYKLKLNHIS